MGLFNKLFGGKKKEEYWFVPNSDTSPNKNNAKTNKNASNNAEKTQR